MPQCHQELGSAIPEREENLWARTDTRRQALRQQIKLYVEDELSSHKIAVRISGSPDGEPTPRCIGGLVYTFGLAPTRLMTYLRMILMCK